MLFFWSLTGVMLLAALLVVLKVLLFPVRKQEITVNAGLSVYRARFNELEQDIRNGNISAENADTARKEMEVSLLNESGHGTIPAKTHAGNNPMVTDRITAIIIAVSLPVFAISLYLFLGQPELLDKPSRPARDTMADSMPAEHPTTDKEHPSIDKMVSKLAERLKQQPDDAEGWWTLASSYMSMDRFSDAEAAFAQLYKMTGDEPRVLLRYADAMIMANDGRFSGKPAELIDKALALEPENTTGLWLAGMAAREKGDYKAAIDSWHKLLPKLENDPQAQQEVVQLINSVLQQADGTVEMPTALPAQTAEQEKTEPEQPMAASSSITVNVTLAPELVALSRPDDTLFVFAKAIQGPPMPVAIVRKKVSDLPLEVTLDDTTAIMPTNKLSGHDSVNVGARISKSGNAIAQSGDLQSDSITTKPGSNDTIMLVINTQVP